ncbi:MAG TPA: HEAT repeat domain-containing protein [Kiritimatiellia bacterium]|nr:HEAT repeat domain-containing protein [Kiritimatiellia bacterium]
MNLRFATRGCRMLAGAIAIMFAAACARGGGEEIDYDAVLYRAVRYGNTEQRREEKRIAREELFARGGDALREVMARAHVENIMLQVLALELVSDRVPAEQGVPVLVAELDSPHEQTRRIAAYLLGFYPRAEEAVPRVLAMLDVEKERNAALRTLGKWKVDAVRPRAAALLSDPAERTRINACNALRELRHPDDLPALIESLADPALLVRNGAARAIADHGEPARHPLRAALARSEGVQQRHIIRLLGVLRDEGARPALEQLADQADARVNADIRWALHQIDPGGAGKGQPIPYAVEEPFF